MKSSSLSAGKRLAYTLSTAQGVPVYYDLSEFSPVLAAIRERSHDLRNTENLAAAFKAARASGSRSDYAKAGVFGDNTLASGRKKHRAVISAVQLEQMALAVVAFERALGVRLFNTQIIAGLVMCGGGLAELATGEGKTFAAALTAIVRAAEGQGCHVLTANDYLAERDAAWIGPVYTLLGLGCSALTSAMDGASRCRAYLADITYLTAREAVYDYLRDGLAGTVEEMRQRPLAAAVVDEADFLMIDQARAPLVIAARESAPVGLLRHYADLAERLMPGQHFSADQRLRRIALTEEGQRAVAESLQLEGMHRAEDLEHFARVHAALYARCLLSRDVDYVVRAGRVELVDGFTGRVADGRRWPYGVQAAVETREGVRAQAESGILGSLTLQRFFPLYPKLAGMTATAVSAAEEIVEVYGLSVYLIPPRLPSRRIDIPDRMFLTLAQKEAALIEATAAEHARGRPVLLVTASVAESEHMAGLLRAQGIACLVLNAKHDREEARLIARAGCRAAVTVSTEMAGRGTDIRLGGPHPDPAELASLTALGGLCILISGRRESRRHDDQLRGRAGRQGEPGTTCFYTSLEDSLFKRYGLRDFLSPQLLQQLEQAGSGQAADLPLPLSAPLQDKKAQEEMDWAQRLIETHLHRLRTARRRSTQMLELQRRRVSALRRDVLFCLNHASQASQLAAIDRFWQEHLALAEDLREGIHLARYGGRDPEREFDRRLDDAFLQAFEILERQIGQETAMPFAAASAPGPVAAGGSGSTWTYQIDEDPLPAFSLPGLAGGTDIVQSVLQLPLLLLCWVLDRLRPKSKKR